MEEPPRREVVRVEDLFVVVIVEKQQRERVGSKEKKKIRPRNSIFFCSRAPASPWPLLSLSLQFPMLMPQGAHAASSAAATVPTRPSSRALAPSSQQRRWSSSSLSFRRRRCRLAEQIVVFAPRAGGGDGISDLLARDKKAAGLLDSDFEEMPAEGEEEPTATKKGESSQSSPPALLTSDASSPPPSSSSAVPTALDGTTPTTCAQAIDAGEAALRSGDASLALELFEAALDLPGSAAVRLSGSPREYSCASDAEAAAALYNMACAYVALNEIAPALTCLEGAVEGGGRGIAESARGDPDLAALRQSSPSSGDFEGALRRGIEAHDSPGSSSSSSSSSGNSGNGGPADVLGGLAARLLRRGGGRDSGSVAGRSVGVLERIMRPW